MPKYYISSGTMKQVVTAEDPMSALKKAVLRAYAEKAEKEFSLGQIAVIRERGFDGYAGDDKLHLWKPAFFEKLGISVTFSKER